MQALDAVRHIPAMRKSSGMIVGLCARQVERCTCMRMWIMPTMRMLIPEMDFSSSSWEASGAAKLFHHLLIHLLMTVYEHRLSMAINMAPACKLSFKPTVRPL